MDDRIRQLERRFKETDSLEDGAALLIALMRGGYLTQKQVELAAQMEYPPALHLFPATTKPFEGGGIPHYEALEDFLFNLIGNHQNPHPELPYLLGIMYLEQTQPILEEGAENTQELFNIYSHIMNVSSNFATLAIIDRDNFLGWITTHFGHPPDLENAQKIDDLLQSEIYGYWFELSLMEFQNYNTAAIHNTGHAYSSFLRAIRNASPHTGNPTVRTFQDLRLCIGAAVSALAEFREQDELQVQRDLLAKIRVTFIPELLHY